MTLCQHCFPDRYWSRDDILQSLIESNQMFWVGYLCCDPKPDNGAQIRSNRYDLYVDEVKKMNFEGVKVLFNHNKSRRPLGEIKLTWHDHNVQDSPFAVGFLAVIDNPMIKDTPACVILMEDTFASLSTLESDRTSVVELSVTYCGARDGCTGVIIPRERVVDMVTKYGLPQSHYYKHDFGVEVDASYTTNTTMSSEDKQDSRNPEDVLKALPQDQYDILKEHMMKDQSSMKKLIATCHESEKKCSDLKELMGHYSDYLSSMIQTRLMLEQNNESDLAKKRREGFEALKKMGVLDKNCSDLQASKHMIDFCRESFRDSPENAHLEKFWTSFQQQFPDLHATLPQDKSAVTVDAAFSLISQKIREHDVSGMVRKSQSLNQRALDIARQEYFNIEHHKSKENNTNRNVSSSHDSHQRQVTTPADMGFDDFLKNLGVNGDPQSDTDYSQPTRKQKRPHIEQSDDDDRALTEYATHREKELYTLERRYKTYKSDFQNMKRRKTEEKGQQMDALMKCIPSLTKLADYLEDHMQNELPRQEMSDRGERSKENPVNGQDADRDGNGGEAKKSIDASSLLRRDV